MGSLVEVEIARMRIAHPGWGPRRLVFELGRAGVVPVPSELAWMQGKGNVPSRWLSAH
jgi:hypothetical protein